MKKDKHEIIVIRGTPPEGITIENIPEPQRTLLVKAVCDSVVEYFKDPEHRKEYEEWHLKEYGEPYVWKYRNIVKEKENEKKYV